MRIDVSRARHAHATLPTHPDKPNATKAWVAALTTHLYNDTTPTHTRHPSTLDPLDPFFYHDMIGDSGRHHHRLHHHTQFYRFATTQAIWNIKAHFPFGAAAPQW